MAVALKEFEKNQLDWWCSYYHISLKDLAFRTRQYLDGEIERGVLEAILEPIEQGIQRRDKHD
tara:strand:- start:296 stop:484 length:189 start_codon:yes stop_codon:yes gene_type:complete